MTKRSLWRVHCAIRMSALAIATLGLILTVCSTWIAAQELTPPSESQPDPRSDVSAPKPAQQDLPVNLELDLDTSGIDEFESENSEAAGPAGFATEAARFRLRHELSFDVPRPSEILTNRTSLRLQWERPIGTEFYGAIDAKGTAYLWDDLRAEDNNNDVLFRGDLRELWVQGSLGNTSLTGGKKIIIWGELDFATVTDEISPRNIGDFIFTSLDESRLGQNMLVSNTYSSLGQFTFLVNPDIEVDELPDELRLPAHRSHKDSSRPEFGFRWKRSIGNGDFAIVAGDLVENTPVSRIDPQADGSLSLVEEFGRFQMLGATANLNLGKTSLEVEMAYKGDRNFNTIEPQLPGGIGIVERDTLQGAFALKHSPDGNRELVFGFATQHIVGDTNNLLGISKRFNNIHLKWTEKFLRETLRLSYEFDYGFETDDKFHQFTGRYSITDDLIYTLDFFSLSTSGVDNSSVLNGDTVIMRLDYFF